nr:PREDICTED: uncharacterized protein YJR142W-like [Lepisosteus oculatus]
MKSVRLYEVSWVTIPVLIGAAARRRGRVFQQKRAVLRRKQGLREEAGSAVTEAEELLVPLNQPGSACPLAGSATQMAASPVSWSDKALRLLRGLNSFYLPGSSRAQCCPFVVSGQQVGWVPPVVVQELARFSEVFQTQGGSVELSPSLGSYAERSAAVDTVLRCLREENRFRCLRGWREEKYEVMARCCDQPLLAMERSATSLFGVKRYGVHVNGFTRQADGQLTMWVARRSLSKPTYPGLLDNMVAGGVACRTTIAETLVKECMEEACIPECIAKLARPVSTVSYTYEDDEGVFPESQFVFDLEVPHDFAPEIGDGEVQAFYLWPMDKVKEVLVSAEFKPNSAMVVLDFLLRHSYLHPDTEPYYQELVVGLHRPLGP